MLKVHWICGKKFMKGFFLQRYHNTLLINVSKKKKVLPNTRHKALNACMSFLRAPMNAKK